MADKNLHFVAVIPPEPLQSEVYEFKKYISAKYPSTKSSLKSPAHITIIPPFSVQPGSEELLIKLLEKTVVGTSPFQLQLHNFDFFNRQTIYVHVEENGDLQNLYNNLHPHFNQMFKGDKGHIFNRPFKAHMTVVNRDFTESDFAAAKTEFEQKKFTAIFEVSSIYLLRFDVKANKWLYSAETKFA
jgi:2'-5' RNA ligase